MAFVLPTFNLTYAHWFDGTPTTDPPDRTGMCQLRGPDQGSLTSQAGFYPYATPCALFPPLEDIRDPNGAPIGGARIEIPEGSGRFYLVVIVDDIAKGFTNEHRYCTLTKTDGWPQPIP